VYVVQGCALHGCALRGCNMAVGEGGRSKACAAAQSTWHRLLIRALVRLLIRVLVRR
jgi:hypothetical protein